MVWNWLRRHPSLVDVGVVLVLAAAYIGHASRLDDWAEGVPLAVVQVAPLLVRRRYPRTVLAVVTGAWIAQAIFVTAWPPVASLVAVYTISASLGRTEGLWATALATLAATLTTIGLTDWGRTVSDLLLFAGAWVVGDNLGTRRAYTRTLEERAERLEREREAEAARARAEEQARIARELHDVIAHSVSVMVVQAAAANDVFDTRPERAREALRAIEASGRTALAEMRRLLGVVRADGADYAPQPGIDRLDDLVEQVRAAGLAVGVSIEGSPRPLPAGVDLSAYRVVQEALTNTLKHANATRADVSVRYADHELGVEVRDDGEPAGNGDGHGRGLIGMRERVTAFGGSLETGPKNTGGFAVSARFPL
ncbi:MAG TPA: sensor histidine kinase [Gaiellaceae bacterium]|nr:sensor histidine kinase [Gaiellaceae bacterium]